MGGCIGKGGSSSTSHTGYNSVDDDDGCTFGRCFCCLFCFCTYPCIPYKGGGSYPQPLRELNEFSLLEDGDDIDPDEYQAFHDLHKERISNQEPIALGWDDIVNQAKTGDLILFKGSSIGSILITTFTGRWSHIGMVYVKFIDIPSADGKTKIKSKVILLWESVSHPDDCVDVLTNTYKDGVRLVDLRKRLLNSDSPFFGIVSVKIPDGKSNHKKAQIQQRFEEFCEREITKPYESSSMNLIRVAFDCGAMGHNNAHDTSTYFCSKLVCETLKHIGIVPHDVNSAKVCPTDFWNYRLNLANRISVEALIFIPRLIKDASIDSPPLSDNDDEGHSVLLKSGGEGGGERDLESLLEKNRRATFRVEQLPPLLEISRAPSSPPSSPKRPIKKKRNSTASSITRHPKDENKLN